MTSDRCLLITLLISLSSIPLLADDTDEVLDSFDKEIDRARKAYERALKKSSEKAIQKLEGIANRAVRKKKGKGKGTKASRAYKEILRLKVDHEGARKYFSDRGQLGELITQLKSEWSPAVLPGSPRWEEHVFYETMLGIYDQGDIPVVNLAVPWPGTLRNPKMSREVQLVASKYRQDSKIEKYTGSGKILIPRDGIYSLTVGSGICAIDGLKLSSADIHLKAGLHSLSFTGFHGKGNFLERCKVRVYDPKLKKKIPIFNSLAAIKSFISTPLQGHTPVDVSGWDPNKAEPLRIEMPSP